MVLSSPATVTTPPSAAALRSTSVVVSRANLTVFFDTVTVISTGLATSKIFFEQTVNVVPIATLSSTVITPFSSVTPSGVFSPRYSRQFAGTANSALAPTSTDEADLVNSADLL